MPPLETFRDDAQRVGEWAGSESLDESERARLAASLRVGSPPPSSTGSIWRWGLASVVVTATAVMLFWISGHDAAPASVQLAQDESADVIAAVPDSVVVEARSGELRLHEGGEGGARVAPRGDPERDIVVARGMVRFTTTVVRVMVQGAMGRIPSPDGMRSEIEAGERLRWPRRAAKDPKFDAAAFVSRFGQLRSQGRYADAVRLAEDALNHAGLSPVQGQRISYDLGLLLEEQLDEPARACRHWKRHLARFPDDPRSQAIAARIAVSCSG